MDDVLGAKDRSAIPPDLPAIAASRVIDVATGSLENLTDRLEACRRCGAVGARTGQYCDVCDHRLDDAAADLPPAAASGKPAQPFRDINRSGR